MRLLIQRVRSASVDIDGRRFSEIGAGLLVFVGVGTDDTPEDAEYLAGKLVRLRIFDDQAGVMNLDVAQIGGQVLAVSQFTLLASTRKGNRPSYVRAAPEAISKPLYESFVRRVEELLGRKVPTGRFGAEMQVSLVNDGPATIWMDSKNRE
ncbi:D-aminoacyl-tRNA deacylase [uncultured Alistipes sp.]|jgi:D-tyrosyl-tRNA(Tyr) deacylase|uniref:D-aminoacyl-tRNA deacylase n=1 Tax=uncultured Alistipes sp. TaxID=538949 RepID=UPI0025F98ECE|nr:D-aminoacyl-tRNA deacylase [uncultured Alistipes sp.]